MRELASAQVLLGLILAACAGAGQSQEALLVENSGELPLSAGPYEDEEIVEARSPHPPGELFDYEAQSGDTLLSVAAHFNTTVDEILRENPGIPEQVTSLPQGFPLRVPAYFLPLSVAPYHLIPNSEYVNGPSAAHFDVREAVMSRPGFLADEMDYAYGSDRPGWEVIQVVAQNYSIHPRLLLTLLEHQSNALSDPFPDNIARTYPLGYPDPKYRGLYRQLLWAAEILNDGYYGWQNGSLSEFEVADGLIARPDPEQGAGTVAVELLMARIHGFDEFQRVIGPQGFSKTYNQLWGEPWQYAEVHIEPDLKQPDLALPFLPNRVWDFTGGPHPIWGSSLPWGALDFAPPAVESGCASSGEWIAAPAAGMIARSQDSTVVLDLDGDGDERTGWVLIFFHVAMQDRIVAGTEVQQGDQLGHPSCEGGIATGTHFHVGRRYNGEWLPADGVVPFVFDGWVPKAGTEPYEGEIVKGSVIVEACTCSSSANRVIYELPTQGEG